MDKIKSLSHKFCILFQIIFYAAPIMIAITWTLIHKTPDGIFSFYGLVDMRLPIPNSYLHFNAVNRSLGFIVSLLPTAVFMFGVHQLISLFRNYEQGIIFDKENVLRYKRLGYVLFASVIVNMLYGALISLALTITNPAGQGQRMIQVSIGNTDLSTLIIAGIILLISWVMREAQTLAEENAQTI